MSATAAAPSMAPDRKLTGGYATIPNSLIENQAHLTRAELALALIVIRKGGAADPVPVSDQNWQKWTGLSPRLKEYAISGLRAKGLEVKGRGETSRYSWRRVEWEKFAAHRERSKPHTTGRVNAVAPKAGAKVHPACRSNGCAMMAAECSGKATPPQKGLTLLNSPSIAQPVAQTLTAAWAHTMATMQGFFPLVGLAFLARLLAIVRVAFADIRDEELAHAVRVAYQQKQAFQKSEGLFLFTVPETVAALRKVPKPAPAPLIDATANAKAALAAALAGMRARGKPFAAHVASLEGIAARLETPGLTFAAIEEIDSALYQEEVKISETALDTVLAGDSVAIAESVESEVKRYRSISMTPSLALRLRVQLTTPRVFEALGIPRLNSLFA